MTGSDASPQAQLVSEEGQQPSRSPSEDDTEMLGLAKKEQKADDNVESSSIGSDGGICKGGGSESGEGYSAGYSSSGSSSVEAAKESTPEKHMHCLSLDAGGAKEKTTRVKEAKPSNGPEQGAQKTQTSVRCGSDLTESCSVQPAKEQEPDYESSVDGSGSDYESSEDGSGSQYIVKQNSGLLPQWNGVKICHPMDPRIDLSTVGHIHTSSVPAFPSNVDIPSRQSAETPDNSGVGPPPPSIDQYIKLMEVSGQEQIHSIRVCDNDTD